MHDASRQVRAAYAGLEPSSAHERGIGGSRGLSRWLSHTWCDWRAYTGQPESSSSQAVSSHHPRSPEIEGDRQVMRPPGHGFQAFICSFAPESHRP